MIYFTKNKLGAQVTRSRWMEAFERILNMPTANLASIGNSNPSWPLLELKYKLRCCRQTVLGWQNED